MKANNVSATIVLAMLSVIAVQAINVKLSESYTQDINPASSKKFDLVFVEGMPVDRVVNVDQEQFKCMALNMYFEARNQNSEIAMAAIGYTVLNRVASKSYPKTICDVVFQGRRDSNGKYIRNKCQFSWVCNGKPNIPNVSNPIEKKAWDMAESVALKVLSGTIDNPVGNATMYHATYVKPYWTPAYNMVAKIRDHIFYEKAKKEDRA